MSAASETDPVQDIAQAQCGDESRPSIRDVCTFFHRSGHEPSRVWKATVNANALISLLERKLQPVCRP